MSKIFILIQIKFDIHINNEKLLETMWKHKEKKVWSSLLVHSNYYSLILCVNMEINSIGFFFLILISYTIERFCYYERFSQLFGTKIRILNNMTIDNF